MTSWRVQVSQPLLFAVVIMSGRIGIRRDSYDNSSHFTDVLVLPARIIDDNFFRDCREEDYSEQGGVEPYQYGLAVKTDSAGVSETQLVVSDTAVNWDIYRLQNTE